MLPDCSFLKRRWNVPYPDRGTYKNWRTSILALIGYSVGLGNFWKFPYLCFQHGGATFLIPYAVALVFIGIPVFFMELALGQYVSLAPMQLFTFMSPIFSGVGYSMVLILFLIVIYYNVIMAWTIFYLGASATFSEPWASCDYPNMTQGCSNDPQGLIVAATHFFRRSVLGLPEGSENPHELRVGMFFALAVAWLLVAICLAGGIRGTSKVLYFTVLYPYVMLAFILVWNHDERLGNSVNNVHKKPEDFWMVNTTRLMEPKIWNAAATHVIYSLGIAYGGIITLASYNKLHQNILRDTFIVCLLDTVTSIFCAYVVYSVTGVLTEEILEEKGSSSALVFIVFPALLSRMGNMGLWALLFFFMIFTLGFDSQLMMVETVTTALFDEFKFLRNRYIPVIAGSCFAMFLLGVPMTTRSGKEIFDMLDAHTSSHSLLLLGLLEVVIVSYVYGFNNMMKRVKEDLRVWVPVPFQFYWAITLKFFTPLSLLILLGFSLYSEYHQGQWSRKETFEPLFITGLILSFSVFIIVPLRAIYVFYTKLRTKGFQLKNWHVLWEATNNFCPEYVRNGRDPNMAVPTLPEDVFVLSPTDR